MKVCAKRYQRINTYSLTNTSIHLILALLDKELAGASGKATMPMPFDFTTPNITDIKTSYISNSQISKIFIREFGALQPNILDPTQKDVWIILCVLLHTGYSRTIAVNGDKWYPTAGIKYLRINPDQPDLHFTQYDLDFIKYAIRKHIK